MLSAAAEGDLAFRRRSCSPWAGCNFIPEDLHPKSFRGSIGHNTNVWAVRDRAGMPVGGPTGVFDMEQVTTYLALLALTARCTGARIRLAKSRICTCCNLYITPTSLADFLHGGALWSGP